MPLAGTRYLVQRPEPVFSDVIEPLSVPKPTEMGLFSRHHVFNRNAVDDFADAPMNWLTFACVRSTGVARHEEYPTDKGLAARFVIAVFCPLPSPRRVHPHTRIGRNVSIAHQPESSADELVLAAGCRRRFSMPGFLDLSFNSWFCCEPSSPGRSAAVGPGLLVAGLRCRGMPACIDTRMARVVNS